MPKKEWMKKEFAHVDNRSCIFETKLMAERHAAKAWVVSIDWLRDALDKCEANGRETIRFSVDPGRRLWIETFTDKEKIDGCPDNLPPDPPGWNNDWPEIDLP